MTSDFDEDELLYGLVLSRLPDGHWWHAYLVRSNLLYDCDLLGRRTTMLFLIQKFARGALAASAPFFLTLNAEGIANVAEVKYTTDWDERSGTDDEKARARAIRQTVFPALHDAPDFRRAAWFIVNHTEHGTIADPDQMTRIEVPPFAPEG